MKSRDLKPGSVEKAASNGNPRAYDFPRSMMHGGELDFSFSGLKTAVLYTLQKDPNAKLEDIAASFQAAVIDVLVEKSIRALQLRTACGRCKW